MCGRYVLHGPHSRLIEQFGLASFPPFPDRYNIAPSTPIPVLLPERRVELLRWGLKAGGTVANIRDDSFGKPWARALLRQRAVVPCSGFYEWQAGAGPGGRKQPWYMRSPTAPYLAIAAAIGNWDEPGVTLITTGPNAVMQPIHDRMPVLLDAAALARWFDRSTPLADLVAMLRPAPDGSIVAGRVGLAVNSSRNEGAPLIEPV